MKEHKDEGRLARQRRLAKALKANLARRKEQRRKLQSTRSQVSPAAKDES
jgi:hypothetical protein